MSNCAFSFFSMLSVLLLAKILLSNGHQLSDLTKIQISTTQKAQAVYSTQPSSSSPEKKDDSYVLEGFNPQKVSQFKKGKQTWDKCWQKKDSYEVCVTRYSKGGDDYVEWTNKKIPMKVQMKKYKNGSISQTWLWDGFGISLFRSAKGRISQEWDFPDSKWTYEKSAEGKVDQNWEGEEDTKSVEKYKSVIDSWCAVNDFYIGKENCIIY